MSSRVSVTTNEAIRHGNMTNWNSTAFQPATSASRPLIPPSGTGTGAFVLSPSRPEARPRSPAPSPRAPASNATSTGNPTTVTASPAPSEKSVTARTNPAIASGNEVNTYPYSRQAAAESGPRRTAPAGCSETCGSGHAVGMLAVGMSAVAMGDL